MAVKSCNMDDKKHNLSLGLMSVLLSAVVLVDCFH